MDEDELKRRAREARRRARGTDPGAGRDEDGGADVPRDEWGVPIDRRHVRSGLYAHDSRWLRMLSGPGRKDFKGLFTLKRLPFLLVGLALMPGLVYYWGSRNLSVFLDPPISVEGASEAAQPAWQAPLEDAHAPSTGGSPFGEAFALWPGGGGAVRADRAGVTAYGAEDGERAWRFDEGEGLCAAAAGTAGADGDLGLVLVEREGGTGDDGAACGTLVALDLDTGEERWRWSPPDLDGVEGLPPRDVRVRAAGPHALASWGPMLVGLDAADGEVLWAETEVPGPGGDCASHRTRVLPDGGGTAALLGTCASGPDEGAPFTAVLDMETGEVSSAQALPDDLPMDLLASTALVSADPVAVVYSSAASLLLDDEDEGDAPEDALLVADGEGGWRRIAATGETGVGAVGGEWSLSDAETATTVHDGVLYASPGDWETDERVLAIDLEAGRVLWDRRVEDHDVQVVGADGDRILAVAEYGDGDDEVVRVMSLPADGEGSARVLADGLPVQPYRSWGAVRTVEIDGGYAVGSPPIPGGSDDAVPLTAAR
ncbi:outer membrane protein assembly factor BamB family protein [Nocardiopsis halophila]|uniref:outer membrane protein assembly factor BamB family protein n=1 Tax=Nocardiopsis halophila TaxID=141692 RepID=UPI000345DBFC|nr:PQQ-binding-like beta-propeller repeat protein [Nocardiopsis halophila]